MSAIHFSKSLLRKNAVSSVQLLNRRAFHQNLVRFAKNDESTIDSYRLPSQTSINEWEFKYDFIPKVSSPKIPPITPEAVKQDIAHEKKAKVEKELLNKEGASSIKVEANDAKVVHGGEHVIDEPEYLHDRGSKPVDVSNTAASNSNKSKKPANRDKYIQSSINPEINQSHVVSLSENEVDHKVTPIEGQAQVIDDIEHDNAAGAAPKSEEKPSSNIGLYAVLALGGAAGGYYYFSKEKK